MTLSIVKRPLFTWAKKSSEKIEEKIRRPIFDACAFNPNTCSSRYDPTLEYKTRYWKGSANVWKSTTLDISKQNLYARLTDNLCTLFSVAVQKTAIRNDAVDRRKLWFPKDRLALANLYFKFYIVFCSPESHYTRTFLVTEYFILLLFTRYGTCFLLIAI